MKQGDIKGYIGGIQKFSIDDGHGIRSTVFLKGCPLRCQWCHNPELIRTGKDLMRSENLCIGCGLCIETCPKQALSMENGIYCIDRERCDRCMKCVAVCSAHALQDVAKMMTVAEVMAEVKKDAVYYAQSGGGITISGGELLSQSQFAFALLRASKEAGYNVALDTSGYGDSDTLFSMAQVCDYILYDIKSSINELHKEVTGVDFTLIRENLTRLAADPAISSKIIIRMPLISGLNDTPEDITATCEFLSKLKLKEATLLPYHELGTSKSKGLGRDVIRFSAPSSERLHEIRDQFAVAGIHAAIGGEDA